jgi:hypothetical protein
MTQKKLFSFCMPNIYFERSLKWAPIFDMADKKEGYLDDVFDVLDANCHPCILMGCFALRWMGAGVLPEQVSPFNYCPPAF